MPLNGSGLYTLPIGIYPAQSGGTASPTQFNSLMEDIAAAISTMIAKDGQTQPTQNLPMNSKKHTGVASAVANGEYLAYGQANPSVSSKLVVTGGTAGGGAVFEVPNDRTISMLGTTGDLTRSFLWCDTSNNLNFGASNNSHLRLNTTELRTLANAKISGWKDSQGGTATAGLRSISDTGDVYIALDANGSSAAGLKHVRSGNGIQVVDSGGARARVDAADAVGEFDLSTLRQSGIGVIKPSDTSIVSTITKTADPHLSVALTPGRYEFELVVWWTSASTTPGIAFDMAYSASHLEGRHRTVIHTTAGLATPSVSSGLSLAMSISLVLGIASNVVTIFINGSLNAQASGNLSFNWAQSVSSATATVVKEGSYLVARRRA